MDRHEHRNWMAISFVVGLLCALTCWGCKGPYDVAWRTMDGVIKARNATAQSLADVAQKQHEKCIEQHGPKTAAYLACIQPYKNALDHWRMHARPAINSALQVTSASVQIAEKAKSNDLKWLELIKPAVCALVKVVQLWGHYIPDKGKVVLNYLKVAESVVCK